MIEPDHLPLSIVRQCELILSSRSGFFTGPHAKRRWGLGVIRPIDLWFLGTPWYGFLRMVCHLRREDHVVGRKRVRRLLARIRTGIDLSAAAGCSAVSRAPGPCLPAAGSGYRSAKPSLVGRSDLHTRAQGFPYLVAVVDWATRAMLSWRVSNTMAAAGITCSSRGSGAAEIRDTRAPACMPWGPAWSCGPSSAAGSATTTPNVPIPSWPGGRPTRHVGRARWRDWRSEGNQGLPSRQTV